MTIDLEEAEVFRPANQEIDNDFTDRTTFLERCKSEVAKRQSTKTDAPDAYRILVGLGERGIGKSELLGAFRRQAELLKKNESNVGFGIVDFEVPRYRDPIEAMLKLRSDLRNL